MVRPETALDRNPTNPNHLSQINFRFIIKRSPTLNYFCTRVNIPGLKLPAVHQPTPYVDIPKHGDKLTFNPFIATFNVDENLENYFDIHRWMRAIGGADDWADYKALSDLPQYTGQSVMSEVTMTVLNSSRNAHFNLTFYDVFPTDLTDIEFNVQEEDVVPRTATVVFEYMNYDFELINH